jgi:hypothetical protein
MVVHAKEGFGGHNNGGLGKRRILPQLASSTF